jgi:hypothetical protein
LLPRIPEREGRELKNANLTEYDVQLKCDVASFDGNSIYPINRLASRIFSLSASEPFTRTCINESCLVPNDVKIVVCCFGTGEVAMGDLGMQPCPAEQTKVAAHGLFVFEYLCREEKT